MHEVQGPIRVFCPAEQATTLRPASSAYEMEPLLVERSTSTSFNECRSTGHVEVLFSDPAALGDHFMLKFDMKITSVAPPSGHAAFALHVGRFKLNLASLTNVTPGEFHAFEVTINRSLATVVVDGRTVLPSHVYDEGAAGPCSDWSRGAFNELTPDGVLLLGAHHAREGGGGGRHSVYSRMQGEVKNIKVFVQ